MKAVYKNELAVFGLNNNFSAMYINNLFSNTKENILIFTTSLYEAEKLYDLLCMYNDDVLLFPMDDFITSEAIAISPEFKTNRIETINNLIDGKRKIVVTHLMGFLRFLPPVDVWKKAKVELNVGDEVNRKELLKNLYNIGYNREINVIKTGDVSVRGFVIDIYPVSSDNPVRVEFFDDEIESIKYFDSNNQSSISKIKSVEIYPNSEFIGQGESEKYYDINNQYKNVVNIYKFMNNPIVVYKDYNQIINSNRLLNEEMFNYNITNKKQNKYMKELDKISVEKCMYINTIDSDINIKVNKKEHYDSKEIDTFNGGLLDISMYIEKSLKKNKTVVLVFRDKKIFNKFSENLKSKYIFIKNIDNVVDSTLNILINSKIVHGGEFGDLIILTERELFGRKDVIRKHKRYFKRGKNIKEVTDIKKGDYVVHDIYGIGKYLGVVTLLKSGIKKDYLQILYRGNDKLYIPAQNMDYITKYTGREGVGIRLNKLGSEEWQKTKSRIRTKVKDIAERLIKINAIREKSQGFAFSKDGEEQTLFESLFPYIETEDQLISTNKIKEAMESSSPMDMLLCGDVGYGKTEVAFRAMFKAVMDSKQVAYLCPTTILSKQQYNNAIERFSNFGVNIAILNRFVTKKEAKIVLERLKEGKVDIVFGTHRLLSNDIIYKDLGLLIVDEEQRFGVMHKEKIKEYKSNIDVLTLSATPIPRTMQMSLVGLKGMALIETPPAYRHPVQTYVLGENSNVVRDAIYKELGRNGQVFVLYNRVDSIERKVRDIEELVPDARVTFVHGQLNKEEIEDKISSFVEKEYDVLVCTTIIETGIDMPNVNTLIIFDSDKFGLSQLYQIRGRVGRSERQAYAYLMYNNKKVLTETAIKRLEVIKNFTELGSGLSIAMRDLSIRGAGDILGSEQAGFIDSVGIELYLKILNEEVNRINGIEVEEKNIEEKPLIDIETHISEDYSDDEEIKIEIHKMINEIDNEDKLIEVKNKILDRFGLVTKKLEIYMYQEWFDKIARKYIEKINTTKNFVEVTIKKEVSKNINGEKLFLLGNKLSKDITFSYKREKIVIKISIMKLEKHYIHLLIALFEKLPVNND